ncbi:MAG: hypothetical protein JWP00_3767 [Chloroflexi bacterium]|nr:hypothetical protein [Chloroflexota bacterium]
MENKAEDKNLINEVYADGSVSETLERVNGVKTQTSAALGSESAKTASESSKAKARAGKFAPVPDQSASNSKLSDSEVEYVAVHNDESAPDYRDEIYREKPVEGRTANQDQL